MKIHHRDSQTKRKLRTKSKLFGTKEKARLSVFRSNKYLYAQLINDEEGTTILSVSEKELTHTGKVTKRERAKKLGLLIAQKSKNAKIKSVLFDKNRYKYHGRVQALAEGAREGGLTF